MSRTIQILCLVAATFCFWGCSHSSPPTRDEIQACKEMQKRLDLAEDNFVARVREIREERILVVEYDRKMIAALEAYHEHLRSILDEEEPAGGGRCHCTGDPLTEVKVAARPRLDTVRKYLVDFNKSLKQDPPDAYVP